MDETDAKDSRDARGVRDGPVTLQRFLAAGLLPLLVATFLTACATDRGPDPSVHLKAGDREAPATAPPSPGGVVEPLASIETDPLLRTPPGTIAPGRKLRVLLAVAENDWRRWGGQRVSADTAGQTCAVISDGSCRIIDDGCGREQQADTCRHVDGYWQTIRETTGNLRFAHDCSRVGVCEARWPGTDRAIDTPAWSAAWISDVFVRAGYTKAEFLPTAYHADYVTAARDGHLTTYRAQPLPARVEPGDLVCAIRVTTRAPIAPTSLAGIRSSREAGGPTPMHCDLVLSVDLAGRTAYVVGGNVMQAVSLIDIPLDERGRVRPDLQPLRAWRVLLRMQDEARAAH